MALFVSGPVNGWMRAMIKIAIIKFQLRPAVCYGMLCCGKKSTSGNAFQKISTPDRRAIVIKGLIY
jgi:hypothetical protein